MINDQWVLSTRVYVLSTWSKHHVDSERLMSTWCCLVHMVFPCWHGDVQLSRYLLVNMQVVLSTRQCILLTGRCLVSVRFYLVYRVGLVDKIFGLVDLVNKALGLVNKPKWHFEMACMLLMITCYFTATAVMMLVHLNTDSSHCNECLLPFSVDNKCHLNAVLQLCNDQCALQRSDITQCICIPTAVIVWKGM